jgi:signal transduction histidine kinase
VLTISDNGVGFAVDEHAGPREGHFGLLGMTERTQRLRGAVEIVSRPGAGACVRVTIPILPAPTSEVGVGGDSQ